MTRAIDIGAKVVIALVGIGGVWGCVSGDAYRPALSSYGSSQQVVSPPDGASIAIAERGQ